MSYLAVEMFHRINRRFQPGLYHPVRPPAPDAEYVLPVSRCAYCKQRFDPGSGAARCPNCGGPLN